jgi:lysophospholipase L1-like esterase
MNHLLSFSFLGAALLGSALPATAFAGETPAASPLVRIEGRTAAGRDGGVRLGFPGVTLHLRFRGTALSMRVEASSDQVYFDVLVDRLPPVVLQVRQGSGNYPLLPPDADNREHLIAIVRRSESWQGTCEIAGFRPGPGGTLLTPPPASDRRLLFIGDSITCGEYIEYRPDNPIGTDSHTTNARLTYAMTLARRFGAECMLVSAGGRGIIRDWQGIRATNNAPQFYELALPDDPTMRWDPKAYVPDAIGICLGTNDFNQGIPDQNEFVNAGVEFLRKIRRDAPQAWIFLLGSPILTDAPDGGVPKRSALRGYLHEIIAHTGDKRIVFAPVSHYPGVPHNGHPTAAENAAMADEVGPLFRRALGW